MRALAFLPIALLLTACAVRGPVALTGEEVPWGAPPAAVAERLDREPVVATDDRQVYHARALGLDATLVYHFDDGGLREIVVLNRTRHADRNRYIEDYQQVTERLRERHGQPAFETLRWRNPLFRDRPARHGDAISAGHLTYLARWNTPGARILTALRGERYQVIHEVIFRPPGDSG